MSTPPEKPVNSIDPFGHVSHETRERVGSEHHPIEGNSEPTRSPYAPTRARERTNAEHISQENDHDAVLSRYAPKKARTQPVQGPDVVTDDDVASLVAPRASERLRGRTERDGVAANESYIASRDQDPDRWPQPISDTSTRSARALIQEFATCSGLKRPFARFNMGTRPRGFPVPRSYRPCPGLLPRIPKPVVTASRCWSFRARWSRNAWRLRPR
jgi:hypothetical protein